MSSRSCVKYWLRPAARSTASMLGHARTSTTSDIYAHALPHRKVELVHALAALLSAGEGAAEGAATEASG
jgi:hypothetical protein